MMTVKQIFSVVASLLVVPLVGRDMLLEFKGAYFLPTHNSFKQIYPHGGAWWGPEFTVQLCNERPWYGFMSVDYLKKHGRSLGLCSPTTVRFVPVAFGIKYFMPRWSDCVDLYAGLGLEAMNVQTKDCSTGVTCSISKWGCGGIAKVGAYCYLPHNLFLDFFIDYSFLTVGHTKPYCPATGLQSLKANVSGALFGAAIGYRF